MSRSSRIPLSTPNDTIEVKSKFDAEFRRFSLSRSASHRVDNLNGLLTRLHCLSDIPYVITYTDPIHGDLLPINNDDNYVKAVSSVKHILRIIVQRKGECYGELNGYGTLQGQRKKNAITKFIASETPVRHRVHIGIPEDFRRVSAIIDVDIVPETHRRVKLMKNGSDKPLGFYIRDGTSVHMTTTGLEKVPGIFISRLVPGGLAESTGLLAVNDEVLEVNGIDVAGKTLDQVTDMMVANSSNLIITVKPVNQKLTLSNRGTSGRSSQISKLSQASTGSLQSHRSIRSTESDTVIEHKEEEEEEEEEEEPAQEEEGNEREEGAVGDEIELDDEEEDEEEEDEDEDEVLEANGNVNCDDEVEKTIAEKQTLISVSTEDEPLLTF